MASADIASLDYIFQLAVRMRKMDLPWTTPTPNEGNGVLGIQGEPVEVATKKRKVTYNDTANHSVRTSSRKRMALESRASPVQKQPVQVESKKRKISDA